MKQSERTLLVITGVIGAALLFFKGDHTIGWIFIMAVAFIGECTEVIASRIEKILTILESKE